MRRPICVQHRNGVTIELPRPLRECWGEVFDALIADVYGISRLRGLDLIVDAGAHLGAFSCLAARCHPSAPIVAFEPDENIRPWLERNLARNGIVERVRVIADPLAGSHREVVFYDHGPGSSNCVLPGRNPRHKTTTTLDIVECRGRARLFIKLDCEGSEGEILEWIARHHESLPPHVVLAGEYHPWCPVPISLSLERLRSAGFEAHAFRAFGGTYLRARRQSA